MAGQKMVGVSKEGGDKKKGRGQAPPLRSRSEATLALRRG